MTPELLAEWKQHVKACEEGYYHTPICATVIAVDAELERLRKVVRATRGLAEKLCYIHDDDEYMAVWEIAQSHRGPYKGPTYVKELEAVGKALTEYDKETTG